MGILFDKCSECKSKEDVQVCLYCKKDVCSKCINRLIYREKTPEWIVDKKVKNFQEYKNYKHNPV